MKQTVFTTGTTVKYYTSITSAGGRVIAIRMEPKMYIDSVGESTFATADPLVIAALKKHAYFGKTFFIKSEPEASTDETPNIENSNNSDVQVVSVADISNKQMALEWLRDNKQMELKATMNVAEVKAQAAAVGIKFSDWV